MSNKRIKYKLLVLFIIFGCTQYSQEQYYPLSEGLTWQYESIAIDKANKIIDRVNSSSTVMAKRKIKDITVTPIKKINNIKETSLPLKTFFYFIAKDDKGIYGTAIQKETDIEPQTVSHKKYFLLYPFSIGTMYNDTAQEVEIESINDIITVPAGTFEKCIKVKGKDIDSKSEWIRWYAPNCGLVKLIVINSDGSRVNTQLLSFKK